jgi:hypothetical protein
MQLHAQTYECFDTYINYKKVINDLFVQQGAFEPEAARISDEERAAITAAGGGSPVYGEIPFESVQVLIEDLKLTEDDVVYDLGSGLGKFIYHVYLMTPARKSIGIELSEGRLKKSKEIEKPGVKVYNSVIKFENEMRKMFDKPLLPKVAGKMFKYIHGNFLEEDMSDATVVYTCSTCFSDECMRSMTDKLAQLNEGLRVLTLKQLAPHKDFHLLHTYNLPMTWSSSTPVYFYVLDREGKYKREAPKEEESKEMEFEGEEGVFVEPKEMPEKTEQAKTEPTIIKETSEKNVKETTEEKAPAKIHSCH